MRRIALSAGIVGLVGVAGVVGVAGCGGEASMVKATAHATPTQAQRCERQHPGVGAVRADLGRQGNAVALASLGARTLAYVADEDSNAIHTMDVDAHRQIAMTKLEGSPAQVLVLADGRVAVTLRDKNRVQILEPDADASRPLASLCGTQVAVEPFGLAATPDDKTVVVTSAYGQRLTALDAPTMQAKFDVKLAREPRAVLIDDTGERAFVAHVVGAKMSVVDLTTDKHEVREIDLRVKRLVNNVSARNANDKARSGCQGFALAKSVQVDDKPAAPIVDGEKPRATHLAAPAATKPAGRIFAPMVTVEPGDPNVRSPAYYGNSFDGVAKEAPLVSVVDGAAERPITRNIVSLGQQLTQECMLPRSAAVRGSTGALYVSCLGIDAIVELDSRGLDPARLERRRWAVPSGPTGLAIDDKHARAVVWSQFDAKVSFIDLTEKVKKDDDEKGAILNADAKIHEDKPSVELATVAYAPSRERAEMAAGRKLFHTTDDRRISSDGSACASCHPDGREDAITWSTPDGPRQTIMLAGRTQATAPYGWLGKHDTMHDYVTSTFTRLGGTGLHGDDFDSLVGFVQAMPGPNLGDQAPRDPAEDKLVARGKELFYAEQQGCASCHVGGPGVDREKHDVGSHAAADLENHFDTPSLHFIAGTAPYFHDGRYPTLESLLVSTDNQMGHTMNLSQRDVGALKAYLETL
ncbi:MAG TPA: hypothetical protein VGM56_26795 [Byssovorax sp.]|jgi:cytochrome c peroxidase